LTIIGKHPISLDGEMKRALNRSFEANETHCIFVHISVRK